jgi:dipeptidyl aminopeptidase/acylaminoacyl peptidase
MKRLIIAIGFVVLALLPLSANDQRARVLLQAAEAKVTIEGDFEASIDLYQEAEKEAKANRALVARALVGMADAYRELGRREAQRIYQRIVEDFSDQKEAYAQARKQLGVTPQAPVHRSVWTPPHTVDIHGKLSPDGRLLPYRELETDPGGLFVRDLTTGTSRRLVALPDPADVGGAEYPEGSAFSRDGRLLAFAWRVRARGIYQLRVVGVDPGPSSTVRVLLDNDDVEWLAPYDWTPDGQWIAVVVRRADRTAAIGLVSSRDGRWRQLQSVEWGAVLNAALSPDGRYLAFDRRIEGRRRDVFVVALDGSQQSAVATSAADDTLVGWSPDGARVLFVSDRSDSSALWSVPVASGRATSTPTLLYTNVGPLWPLGVTPTGAIWSVVMAPGGAQVRSVPVGPDGLGPAAETRILDDFAGPTTTLRWSGQGEQLAWASQWLGVRPILPLLEELQGLRLNIRGADGVVTRRLHLELDYINDFDWAADDRSLVAAGSVRGRRTGLFRIDVETGRTVSLVSTPGEEVDLPPSGSVTANHVYYRRIRIAGQTSKLVEHDLRTGDERDVLPWAGRFYRGRPDPDSRAASAIDVLAITPDRHVLYLASRPGGDMLSLNAVSIADGRERELMRTSAADTLALLGVTAEAQSAIVRKDVGGTKRSEVWLVPLDGTRAAARLSTPDDLSGFVPIGWSADRSRLLLSRRLSADKSELASLSASGELTRLPAGHELYWTALSPDGRRLAYGTAFREPAAPLAVWVLEHLDGARH